jgi:hypothetical protein
LEEALVEGEDGKLDIKWIIIECIIWLMMAVGVLIFGLAMYKGVTYE